MRQASRAPPKSGHLHTGATQHPPGTTQHRLGAPGTPAHTTRGNPDYAQKHSPTRRPPSRTTPDERHAKRRYTSPRPLSAGGRGWPPKGGPESRPKTGSQSMSPDSRGTRFVTQKRSRETNTKKGAAYGPHRCTPHARITATETTTMLPTTRMPKHSETTTACKRLRRRTTAAEDGQGPASNILSNTLHYDSEPRAPCRRKEQHQHGLTTHGANAPMRATRRSPHTPEPACHGTENQAKACNHGNGEQHSHGIHQLGRTTPCPNNILRTEMPSDDAARSTHL